MKKLIGNGVWILVLGGIFASVPFMPKILGTVLHPEVPTAVVISGSMWPVLRRGDMVLIREIAEEDIKIGTVLIFNHNDGITIHRVIKLFGDTIVTRGDANTSDDDPITYADVVGENPVWLGRPAVIPLIGRLALMMGPSQVAVTQDGAPAPGPPSFLAPIAAYAKSPLGIAFLVLIPGLLLATAFFGKASAKIQGGRKLSKRQQRHLERLRKRWPKARLA